MKKWMLFLLLTMLTLFSLAGCSREILENPEIMNTDKSMKMSYEKFTGARSRTVTLKAHTLISIDVVTHAGELAVRIQDASGNSVYAGDWLPTEPLIVTIDKDDDYTIQVEAKAHEGCYAISWK